MTSPKLIQTKQPYNIGPAPNTSCTFIGTKLLTLFVPLIFVSGKSAFLCIHSLINTRVYTST